MTSGKPGEELARVSTIANAITPNALLLNESLASTDEPGGAEIVRQIVTALRERGIRFNFVTHLYAFACDLSGEGTGRTHCSCARSGKKMARGLIDQWKASRWKRVMGWICIGSCLRVARQCQNLA